MPTPTYTPLATVTLASTATSITFSSIPATYRDLILVLNGKATASVGTRLRVNNDTGSTYQYIRMGGNSGGVFSDNSSTNFVDIGLVNTSDGFQSIVQFMDYSATNKQKTMLIRLQEPAAAAVLANVGRWDNLSAITTIQVYNPTFAVGFTASLYGIVS
jgi:hypothetical protein